MSGSFEKLSTFNSFLRTLLAIVVMAVVGGAGWIGYQSYYKHEFVAKEKEKELTEVREQLELIQTELGASKQMVEEQATQIVSLNADVAAKAQQIQKLDTALRLLKVDHRVARLTVLDQIGSAEDDDFISIIEFTELDDAGKPIENARIFQIKGDVIYLDNWIVKFDDKFVEQADIDRSTSLVLFRRIFGEKQQPQDGFPIDTTGGAPKAYARGGEPSAFEKRIWSDFWTFANDEAKAKEMGIRAAHGEAVSIKVIKGKSYKVNLRASDGLSISTDDSVPVRTTKPAA